MKPKYPALLLCVLSIFSCQLPDEAAEGASYWESFQPFISDYLTGNLEKTTFFSNTALARGEVALDEASGLAWSRNNPGFIWAHQDSGNDNSLFLLDSENGEIVATYRIQGTQNRDWEDIEIAPGPIDGHNYLYIGDFGDNNAAYGSYTIYRFEEPRLEEPQRGKEIDLEIEIDHINYRYPEQDHDVEALMVDPLTKDIYLVTKRDIGSILYVAPYPQPLNDVFTVLKGGEFPFWGATAATVSEEGHEILIKTYEQLFYWQRQGDEPLVETLSREPLEAPYNPVETQGEAICFGGKGGYYTLGEFSNGIRPVLYYYARK